MNPLRALNKQYISGIWRDGSSTRTLHDRNPYDGEIIAEFRMASRADLAEAYSSAQKAQREWAEVNAYQKRDILERAIRFVEENERDIIDIIMDELGGTRLKAFFEIGLVGAELAKKIRTGAVHINDGTINDEPVVAFGGEKDSGFGRLNGRWALEEFSTLKRPGS